MKMIFCTLLTATCCFSLLAQNVGIGISNPNFPLDINGRIRLRHNGGTPGIWFNKADNLLASFVGQQNDTVFGIWHNDANSWRFGFDHKNIRLGIGTATPAYPLSFDNSLGDKISLYGGTVSPGGNHYGFGIQGSLLQMFVPGSVDNIAFGTGRSASFTERMRITGAGKVGIGSTNPDYPLTVNTTIAGGGMVHTLVGANVSVGTFANASGGWLQTFSNHPLFLAAFNGDAALTVATNKNIGIGTTTPSTTLDVNGTIRVRGGTPGAGQVLTSDVNGLASWESLPHKALAAVMQPNQTIPTGATRKLNFQVRTVPDIDIIEFNDFGSGFNNATGEFTVPANQGGVYKIEADIGMSFSPDNIIGNYDYYLTIFATNTNGQLAIAQTYTRRAASNFQFEWNIDKATALVKLAAGDKVSVYATHNMQAGQTATVITNPAYSYFRIEKLY